MKAIVHHTYGTPDVLRYADVDQPDTGPDDVLVEVRAASLNFADRAVLSGIPRIGRLAFGLTKPKHTILGRDIAGTVVRTGAGVTAFEEGDEVLGEMEQRGFAEYVAAPAAHLVRKPRGITFEQAATLPVAGTTAYQAVEMAQAGKGGHILVNGASGGVGTFAVQLAKIKGAEVTAVCSARNVDHARSIGADHVIDYRKEDFTEATTRYDAVVDVAGGHRVTAIRRVLTRDGVYVSTTGEGGPTLGPVPRLLKTLTANPFVPQKLRILSSKRDNAILGTLATLVAEGKLTPVISRLHPLSDTADAMRERHAGGKTVLTV
ncbi:NAD(P)-dependent alcohol dehydrogenase [Actinokineospora auranticolor]|uniref:NADPH:quinone reductase-like Zn-dependent oxidoreductase n=1 Tax=Actinokineospora auranticolor TaxID=155976 RepID=A0A2S6GME3_9PSEU|nr:NAD(P)-dependent alcohol dehydrogenase [Actinokineospora auranticolor]PPK66412.1 NADPH:quinone reductase-like Zn-dependent oxidoreductase [Actinokineospora auranticolor]